MLDSFEVGELLSVDQIGLEPRADWCEQAHRCLLYTSDAADERSSVDLGGRRIIKKKKVAAIGETLTYKE